MRPWPLGPVVSGYLSPDPGHIPPAEMGHGPHTRPALRESATSQARMQMDQQVTVPAARLLLLADTCVASPELVCTSLLTHAQPLLQICGDGVCFTANLDPLLRRC